MSLMHLLVFFMEYLSSSLFAFKYWKSFRIIHPSSVSIKYPTNCLKDIHKIRVRRQFGTSLEGYCPALEVTQNLKLLITFGMCLEWVCH
jgi:hypothetical protein